MKLTSSRIALALAALRAVSLSAFAAPDDDVVTLDAFKIVAGAGGFGASGYLTVGAPRTFPFSATVDF